MKYLSKSLKIEILIQILSEKSDFGNRQSYNHYFTSKSIRTFTVVSFFAVSILYCNPREKGVEKFKIQNESH